MIKGILFDLDGTLLNTLNDLKSAVNYALSQYNLDEIDVNQTRNYIGNGIRKLMERAINSDSINIDESLNYFKSYYEKHIDDTTIPYDGIINMLDILTNQGYKVAIVTNKYQAGATKLSKKFFSNYTNVYIGNQEGIKTKPDVEMVNLALNQLNLKAEECIFVGDSNVDALTAKNAKMPFVYVSWGYKNIDEMKEYDIDYIINKPMELINILKEINK